jgi:hypothetical protein
MSYFYRAELVPLIEPSYYSGVKVLESSPNYPFGGWLIKSADNSLLSNAPGVLLSEQPLRGSSTFPFPLLQTSITLTGTIPFNDGIVPVIDIPSSRHHPETRDGGDPNSVDPYPVLTRATHPVQPPSKTGHKRPLPEQTRVYEPVKTPRPATPITIHPEVRGEGLFGDEQKHEEDESESGSMVTTSFNKVVDAFGSAVGAVGSAVGNMFGMKESPSNQVVEAQPVRVAVKPVVQPVTNIAPVASRVVKEVKSDPLKIIVHKLVETPGEDVNVKLLLTALKAAKNQDVLSQMIKVLRKKGSQVHGLFSDEDIEAAIKSVTEPEEEEKKSATLPMVKEEKDEKQPSKITKTELPKKSSKVTPIAEEVKVKNEEKGVEPTVALFSKLSDIVGWGSVETDQEKRDLFEKNRHLLETALIKTVEKDRKWFRSTKKTL